MSETASNATTKPLAGMRVLIAEDNPDNVVLAKAILAKAGAAVDIAWNGEQAVEYGLGVAGAPGIPDVILMDLMMPVMDGWTAAEHLRRAGFEGRIVALTALGDASHRETSLARGCDDYLAKPYEPQALLDLVRQAPQDDDGPDAIRADLFERLKNSYARRLGITARRLRDARDGGDVERLTMLTHGLKGSAGTYGYPRISELAGAANAALEETGDPSGVSSLLLEIESELEHARAVARS